MSQKQVPEQSLNEILDELEEYMNMFATAGWQRFMESTEHQLKEDLYNAHSTHKSNDEWQMLRGHTALAKRILGFENLVRQQIDQVEEAIALEKEQDDGEAITL